MNPQIPTEFQSAKEQQRMAAQTPRHGAERSAGRLSSISNVILPAILLLTYLAQCAWFIQSQSFTFDEPVNILSGLEQWRTGQFSGGVGMNDHPPMARLLCTLPAINSKFQIGNKVIPNPDSIAWNNSDFDSFGRVLPDPQALAWHTRPVNAILGAILGLLLWLAARGLYSIHAANFILALYAFSPSLIGHFSLAATNDGAITLMLFATVFQLCRWRRNQSWSQTALLGLALGGLLISKASGIPFFVIAIALMLILKPNAVAAHPVDWNWRRAGTAVLLSFLILWGAYHFHVAKVSLAVSDLRMRIDLPNRTDPVIRQSERIFQVSIPVPAFEFIQGLGYQLIHDQGGHWGFLLGRSYRGGSPLYFPIVILLKWPTVVLALMAAALGFMILRRTTLPRDFPLWAAFPVAYFLLAEFSKLNLGERYILPVYPFGLLLCGSLFHFTKGHRAVLVLLLVALSIHITDVLRYAPDYLSYFNIFVSPSSSYKLLSDSNVDWGEGLVALRHYQQEHSNVPIHLAYYGNVAPAVYGIRAIPLMPNERTTGTVIVSASYLSGQSLPDPNAYRWLLQYPTKLILNHSLYVFEVPEEIIRPALAIPSANIH